MSLTPDQGVLVAPEEVLESDRGSLITGMAIARAWRDSAFRSRLISDPKRVLIEIGLQIPESMAVRVFEDTPDIKHISITRWTSEPSEIAVLFRGLLPIPEGIEIRLIQNTEAAVCLVVPVAPPEPEHVTDVERLRRLAPRASVFGTAESVVSTLATEFGSEAAAAAAATAHVNTETETATATATAFSVVDGVVTGVIEGGPQTPTVTMYGDPPATVVINEGPGVVIVLDGGVTIAEASISGTISTTVNGSAETSVVSSASAEVYESETVVSDITAAGEISIVADGVEAQTVLTTTSVGAELEVVAVGAIVAT